MRWILKTLFGINALLAVGCVSLMQGSVADDRTITVFYASLFNQRTTAGEGFKSWVGDWLFRRERLLLVDRFLRDRKPDILVLQEVMSRNGSNSESDLSIIGTQTLVGYEWDTLKVKEYPDTNESEFHGVASGLPIQQVRVPPTVQRRWELQNGLGHVTLFILELDQRQIPVFNVEARPGTMADVGIYLAELESIILSTMIQDHYCPKRLIVAGRMPASYTSKELARFLEVLDLKDVSDGLCDLPSDCYTASPSNEIYTKTSQSQIPSQMDHIFVNQSAFVPSVSTVLNQPGESAVFLESYGLSKMWPTERFGWYTNLRLRQCSNDDYWGEDTP